jgi:manganese/zinc/iron transport system substrate-binding protein
MRYFLGLFSLSILIFAGCSSSASHSLHEWMSENGRVKTLSTISQVGDLVREVGGDRVDSLVLIQGDLDPHSYELVKGDDDRIRRANLIFYSGLGLEHGASLSAILHSEEKAISIGDSIAAQVPDRILYRGKQADPHLWMDISLWQRGVDAIEDALVQIDPNGADGYHQRAAELRATLEEADREIQERLKAVSEEKRYLVTSHDAFQYFVRHYLGDGTENWHERLAAPAGLSPEGQLNPVDLQRTVDFVRQHRVSVLFSESNVSRASIQKIVSSAQELNIHVRLCSEVLYGDSVGNLGYLASIIHNAETLATAWEETQ